MGIKSKIFTQQDISLNSLSRQLMALVLTNSNTPPRIHGFNGCFQGAPGLAGYQWHLFQAWASWTDRPNFFYIT